MCVSGLFFFFFPGASPRYSSPRYSSPRYSAVRSLGTTERNVDKSPLLANGYNPPPTHLSPMQFMALNHAAQQAAAAAAAQHAAIHQTGLAGLGLANHHGAHHQQTAVAYPPDAAPASAETPGDARAAETGAR